MEENKKEWSESEKKAIWRKGRINPDHSPEVLRWDRDGHVMMWSEYGRRDSKFGWGIRRIEREKGKKRGSDLYPVNLYYIDKSSSKPNYSPKKK